MKLSTIRLIIIVFVIACCAGEIYAQGDGGTKHKKIDTTKITIKGGSKSNEKSKDDEKRINKSDKTVVNKKKENTSTSVRDSLNLDRNDYNTTIILQTLEQTPEELNKLGDKAYKRYEYEEAIKYYLQAAKQGDVRAQCKLGRIYYYKNINIQDAPKDFSEAVKWFTIAAEQGYAEAQYYLGTLYDWGWGVSQDYNEAVKWYRKGAEQGNADAQYNLGLMYTYGHGIVEDEYEAFKWYKKSAEQGNCLAQNTLAYAYEHGRYGLKRDIEMAKYWYRKAAEQNYQPGKDNLKRLERY